MPYHPIYISYHLKTSFYLSKRDNILRFNLLLLDQSQSLDVLYDKGIKAFHARPARTSQASGHDRSGSGRPHRERFLPKLALT